MRHVRPLALALALSACATAPDNGPTLRYADAVSRGALASFLAGRPSADQVAATTAIWSNALADSAACGAPLRTVADAGLVGALEIGAMSAAASGGEQRDVRQGVSRYIVSLASLAFKRRERPEPGRCATVLAWAPRIASEGRDAVARARANGLIDEDDTMLLRLLGG